MIPQKSLKFLEGGNDFHLGQLGSLGNLADLHPEVDLILSEGLVSLTGTEPGVRALALLADGLIGGLRHGVSDGLGTRSFIVGGLLLVLDLVFWIIFFVAVVAVDFVGLTVRGLQLPGFDERSQLLGL